MLEKEVLSSQACTVGRTRGNRHKLLQVKFPLDIRKVFFTMSTTKSWNRLLTEVWNVPHGNYLRFRLAEPCITPIYITAFRRSLDQMTSRTTFQPGLFYDCIVRLVT